MSDDLTARDVIARVLAEASDDRAWVTERSETMLAALAAAGYTIVTTDDWEWNVRMDGGTLLWKQKGRTDRDEVAAHCLPGTADQLIRRRPAGPWEVVPDAR